MASQDTATGYPPLPRKTGTDFAVGYPPPVAPANAQRLLWAGFFAILASGVGFGVRAGVLVDWARDYGFTQAELGGITGGGLQGFGFIIIFGSLIADRIGYGRLMLLSFVMHVGSAALQLSTSAIYDSFGSSGVMWSLYVAMFMFSIGNGICEVVVNPMTATLFPNNKTHYLNILHAGWPGGMIIGGLIAFFLGDVHWIIRMSLFLVPVAIYGVLLLGQRLPVSEAGEAGVSYWEMFGQFASPILLTLLLIQALVGFVELGTDSWISKITGTIMGSAGLGLLLFIYTSSLMFILRFCAGPIERATSPLGLLFTCACLATCGLLFLGNATAVWMCVAAATIYGLGKTFFWPTMLAVVSERFPRGGAIVMGAVGGAGMLSAGYLGSPGIGFEQDYYASQTLKADAAVYKRYAAQQENSFLFGIFHTRGLDGTKASLAELAFKAQDPKTSAKEREDAQRELKLTIDGLRQGSDTQPILTWWEENKDRAASDWTAVNAAGLEGGRQALIWTAAVPATMAVLYLLLILYFKATGGYKRVAIETPYEPAVPGADL